MIIRQETPEDYNEVYELVKQAFSTTSYSDGTEQDYLNDIRKKDCFIPELSLVAVEENAVVGQIVLYKMQIACKETLITQLVVSPLSVLPASFGQWCSIQNRLNAAWLRSLCLSLTYPAGKR